MFVVRYFVVGSPRVGPPDDDDYDDDEGDVDLFDSCLWYALTSISAAFRPPKAHRSFHGPLTKLPTAFTAKFSKHIPG